MEREVRLPVGRAGCGQVRTEEANNEVGQQQCEDMEAGDNHSKPT
jgi:hypothetical protein